MATDTSSNEFFESGFYEDYYGWRLAEEDSRDEARKVLALLGAGEGRILDWCGGWGRHALYFAEAGLDVTLLDFMESYLERARRRFAERGLPLDAVRCDCRETPAAIQADYAACLMNSIGFLPAPEQTRAFRSLRGALKDGAKAVVDCMNLLALEPFIKVTEKRTEDGSVFRSAKRFDFRTNVEHMDFEIVGADGRRRARRFEQTHYAPRDLCRMMEDAGFRVLDVLGGYDGRPVGFKTEKMVLLAERRP